MQAIGGGVLAEFMGEDLSGSKESSRLTPEEKKMK